MVQMPCPWCEGLAVVVPQGLKCDACQTVVAFAEDRLEDLVEAA